jgi:hypothetical protein
MRSNIFDIGGQKMNLCKHQQNRSPIADLSNRYQHVDTMRIHDVLRDHGFVERDYHESRVRKQERIGYQKHFSIFNRPDLTDGSAGAFNVMLFNSHDGTTAVRLDMGYFRIACENQLVHSKIGVRVAHQGDVLGKLNDRLPLLLKQFEDFRAIKDQLDKVILDWDQLDRLAMVGLQLRGLAGADAFTQEHADYIRTNNIQTILRARRHADAGGSAWAVLNRIQETVIKGSPIEYVSENKRGDLQWRRLRPVTEPGKLVRYNQALMSEVIDVAGIKVA